MTLSSRHRIWNSHPGGLRPSTLPLGHGGSPQYWLSHVDGEETFCFFQTAETGNRTPNSGVKGSGANHYPRAPAQTIVEIIGWILLNVAFLHIVAISWQRGGWRRDQVSSLYVILYSTQYHYSIVQLFSFVSHPIDSNSLENCLCITSDTLNKYCLNVAPESAALA